MRLKIVVLFIVYLSFTALFASSIVIDSGKLTIKQTENGLIPTISGFQLNGIGKKPVLPYKNFDFSSPVVKVVIEESQIVALDDKLALGHDLFTITPNKMVKFEFSPSTLKVPTLQDFYSVKPIETSKSGTIYRLVFNPVIPSSDGTLLVIKKIRVYFSSKSPQMKTYGKAAENKTMLIVTTNDIRIHSKELLNFIATKKAHGFLVDVATETQFGGEDIAGVEKVLLVRKWLSSQVGKYAFLLIIADPTPTSLGVPMLTVKPGQGSPSVKPQYEAVYTDMIYAVTVGNWDSNEDKVYGTREDVEVSFQYDFIVGRIPVYNNEYAALDTILKRTVTYINHSTNQPYRKKILFPASIAYYARQDNQMGMPKMDGAYVAEYFRNTILPETFEDEVLVEKSGLSPSEYTDYPALTSGSLMREWNKGYGCVYWMAHGLENAAYRTIWQRDSDNDGVPTSYDMDSPSFITSQQSEELTKAPAAFVFEGSCLNGKVTAANNLGYSMLKNTAIGVVASSQITFGSIYAGYDPNQSPDVFAYGVAFSKAVVTNESPAKAMMDAKQSFYNGDIYPMIKMELNYLGDPSLTLDIQSCLKDEDCDDTLFCNGQESCVEGVCIHSDALRCDNTNSCHTSFCSEKTKSCENTMRDDGTLCAIADESPCFLNYQCISGSCEGGERKDCSSFDDSCNVGACNETTGACVFLAANEGESCNTELFCIENAVCKAGECRGDKKDCGTPPDCQKLICQESSESCEALQDIHQNALTCTTEDGESGTCYYGVCKPSAVSHDKSSSTGCSAVFISM
ncbi:hypothetical protein KAH37_10350 [bacterium]|nr:hypothetical protein [bacterium]